MTKNVVITGPESSGKTTLALALSDHFDVKCIEEYAREYLDKNGPKYNYQDVIKMAKHQIKVEANLKNTKTSFNLFDTDLITYKIWLSHKYGRSENFIDDSINDYQDRLYLLLYPDIPWKADPLRENPSDRHLLFDLYKEELDFYNLDYTLIEGDELLRKNDAISAIVNYL